MTALIEPTCVICEKDMEICCTTNCGHSTCEDCILKYFVLEQKSTCILCREVDPKFGFYNYSPDKILDYKSCRFPGKIGTKKFYFQNQKVYNKVLSRMSYTCPKDGKVFTNFDGIKKHVNRDHDDFIRICNLCCTSNKILPCETTYFFNNPDLQNHITQGNPDIGFEGHPACQFCSKERFYSSDELKEHMSKSKHVSCYVCKEIPSVLQKDSWFLDSLALDSHLKKSHFACYRSECPLTAFATRSQSEMHDIEVHGATQASFLYSDSHDADVIQNRETSQTANEESTFSDHSELGMRKLRFKERARHYWGNSPEKMDIFFESNACYVAKEFGIHDLVDIYNSLFAKNEKEEAEDAKNLSAKLKKEKQEMINHNIALLLRNFADTVKNDKSKYKELIDFSKKMAPEIYTAKDSANNNKNNGNKNLSEDSLGTKMKNISLSSSTLQNARKIQPKVFQPLPTLPGGGGGGGTLAFAESPYFKNPSDEIKNQKLPSLPSLNDIVQKKTPSLTTKNKNILTGAGQSLLSGKTNRNNKSVPGSLPSLPSLPGSSENLFSSSMSSSSNQSIQIIPNNAPLIRNQAVIHTNTNTNSLPGLPTLAKKENVKAKEIRMKILQKQKKGSKSNTVDMTQDYQDRLADIRNRTKKIDDRGLMKDWAGM